MSYESANDDSVYISEQRFAHGLAPNLDTTLTDFRLSYVVLVVLGSQRVTPVSASMAQEMDYGKTLELLLERGANPNLAAINGATPLHLASAIYGKPALVRILLKHGADANARDRYGQVRLFDAMLTSEVECVEALMEGGADPTIPTWTGQRLLLCILLRLL